MRLGRRLAVGWAEEIGADEVRVADTGHDATPQPAVGPDWAPIVHGVPLGSEQRAPRAPERSAR